MLKLKKRSLSAELTLSLFLLLFLVESALFTYVYVRQSRFMREELEKKADAYAASLSDILAVPMWDFDDEQINKICANFIQDDIVHALQVSDLQDRLFCKHNEHQEASNLIHRTADIVHKGQHIGKVQLCVCQETHNEKLVWLRNLILAMLAGSLAVIFITTGMILRVLIRRPLASLQNGIARVAEGDYSYRFEDIRHTELSGIAERIREMASVIQSRESSLGRINAELQEEVAVRKAVENKIRQNETRSLALLDAIPDVILQFDRGGNCLDYRGQKTEAFDASEKFIGKNLRDILSGEVAQRFSEHIVAALDTQIIQFFEYDRLENGRARHYECRMVSFFDDVALVIVRNITQNRLDAEEKSQLEERLRQAQKMEALGTLAGGVAHDLNNILSGIVSYPEMLLMDMAPDSPLRKPLMTVKEAGDRAATIVQDLLTLARRGVTVTEVVNLNDILQQYLVSPELRRLKAYHPGIGIVTGLEERLMNISGSPVHLSKMIMNLIANAAEAMPEGGQIVVSTRNQYIDLPVHGYDTVTEGDYVVFAVSDTGVGISEKDMKRIFEPFYTKKIMGRSGTGLGMAVVWGTVKDHKGYIDIRSTVGLGTSITLYLPATREMAVKSAEPVSIAAYKGRGESILVVDDIKEQREIASDMLTRLNYTVATVESGEQAVEYVKTNRVDLLVLDMIMDPGMDGFETYRRILEIHPGQKAVIASGFSETDRVRKAQMMGAGEYIKKPYTLEKIGTAVRKELRR